MLKDTRANLANASPCWRYPLCPVSSHITAVALPYKCACPTFVTLLVTELLTCFIFATVHTYTRVQTIHATSSPTAHDSIMTVHKSQSEFVYIWKLLTIKVSAKMSF